MVANKFNNCYINVSQNLLKYLGETNNRFQDYLKNHKLQEPETTLDDEVAEALKSLTPKKLISCMAYNLHFSRYLVI